MALHDFLTKNRSQILAASEKRVVALAALRPTSDQLQCGLPLFLDQLVDVLSKNQDVIGTQDEVDISETASSHGHELLRLGYTLTHVVHAYGAMCQAITEVASETSAPVTALEFHHLNRCLDIAIAGAVTKFEAVRHLDNKNREVVHLGAIAHELRNALNRARISFEMLAKGMVGLGGSTSRVLERSLKEMDLLINRSLSEVRLRADSDLNEECFAIIEIISQLVVTAEIEAAQKHQTLIVSVDPKMSVKTDRHLVLAALGNLIQNAMKFTKPGGTISILGVPKDRRAHISVKDECGGIPQETLAKLFGPFVQESEDRTGLGLGLMISKQAIKKCGGKLNVVNSEGGCTFTIVLPLNSVPIATVTAVV